MPILAGERVTAGRLNRMQPVTYHVVATSDLAGSVTATAVPGATVPITTTTANAKWAVVGNADFDTTGAGTTTIASVSLLVDGSTQAGSIFSQHGAATANDRGTPGQNWGGTLAAAGGHIFHFVGTVPANMSVKATHTRFTLVITEVV